VSQSDDVTYRHIEMGKSRSGQVTYHDQSKTEPEGILELTGRSDTEFKKGNDERTVFVWHDFTSRSRSDLREATCKTQDYYPPNESLVLAHAFKNRMTLPRSYR
jgi:hypothetical protein